MTTATEYNTPPLFSGFASRSEMLFPIQQPVDDSQCCCCCCRAAAFSFRRSEERRPLEQKQKQKQKQKQRQRRRRRRWLSLLCFDGYKKIPPLPHFAFFQAWVGREPRLQEICRMQFCRRFGNSVFYPNHDYCMAETRYLADKAGPSAPDREYSILGS